MNNSEEIAFSFSAIVGNEDLKLALLLNAIDPTIGGVLIKGPKGTGKSMAVRALASILPDFESVKNCPFHCHPSISSLQCEDCRSKAASGQPEKEIRKMKVVVLPLGVTEDRLIGSLDISKALKEGTKAIEPGILAEANQGILYIDEINLLADHIVDDLLDVVASGWNYIERSGVSVKHPSRFIFIGSMNPEEGELRPQILDRLPLVVHVQTAKDINARMQVVERNLQFETDPQKFREEWDRKDTEIRIQILAAKQRLKTLKASDGIIHKIATLCALLKLDGYRPDIVLAKTGLALAAWEGKADIDLSHLQRCAPLVFTHRTREGGLANPPTPEDITRALVALKTK